MPLHLSQFWNIVPLEQLLAQLEVEKSASVIRRLVKLLVNSFHPISKGVDVQVSSMTIIVELRDNLPHLNLDSVLHYYMIYKMLDLES